MPRHTEPSANTALANILRRMMHGCNIRSESTQTIAGNKALQPDILITASDRAPVVIEAEFMPAYSVEDEAAARLIIELDGGQHETQPNSDHKRTKYLQGSGYHVLRFWNSEVLEDTDAVLQVILVALESNRTRRMPARPHPP